jgi:hypothetical protein
MTETHNVCVCESERERDLKKCGSGSGEGVKLVRFSGVRDGGVSDESERWVGEIEAGNGQMVPQFSGHSDYQYSALPHLSD